ncbi:MAG: DNA primase [Bowdeniella nasicola]|nr:DNA primase [Bowdeniella nasicola]
MATDPRAALDRFIAALEAHYQAAATLQNPDADAVVRTEEAVEDAFLTYDDAIMLSFDVDLPLDTCGYDDDDFDDDDLDDEDAPEDDEE